MAWGARQQGRKSPLMACARASGIVVSSRAAFWKPALGGPIMTPWHMPPGDGSHRGRVLLGPGRTRHRPMGPAP